MTTPDGRGNFNHDDCYRHGEHAKTKSGRAWCRKLGPASRSGRSYASRATHRRSSWSRLEMQCQRTSRPPRSTAVGGLRPLSDTDPQHIRLLLVAEAPPKAQDRYFYFDDVHTQDSLFRYVARSLLPDAQPTRENKPVLLAELRDRGVFLIDLKQDPVDGTALSAYVPDLVRRVRELQPERIVLIKATVYDAAYAALAAAGLPVSSVRVPFPGSGRQKQFEEAFAKATRFDYVTRPVLAATGLHPADSCTE